MSLYMLRMTSVCGGVDIMLIDILDSDGRF